MKIIGYTVTTIGLYVVSSLMRGWALVKLWKWFILTKFEAPHINWAEACGIALIISYLTIQLKQNDEDKDKKYSELLALNWMKAILHPLIVVGMGAIYKIWAS